MMTTISTPWKRKEPYYLMVPIDAGYARQIERVVFVIDGDEVEVRLDELSQSFVADPNG